MGLARLIYDLYIILKRIHNHKNHFATGEYISGHSGLLNTLYEIRCERLEHKQSEAFPGLTVG